MAEIRNAEVARHCNEKARRLADQLKSVRRTCEQYLIDIVLEFETLTAGDANVDVIVDDPPGTKNGRSAITKGDILALKFVAEQCAAALNQDDREALVGKVAVNGLPLF